MAGPAIASGVQPNYQVQPSMRVPADSPSQATLQATTGLRFPSPIPARLTTTNSLSVAQEAGYVDHHCSHHHKGKSAMHHHAHGSSVPGQSANAKVPFPKRPMGHPDPVPPVRPTGAKSTYQALPQSHDFPISTLDSTVSRVPPSYSPSTINPATFMSTTPSSQTLTATQQTQRWINESQIHPVPASKVPSMQFPVSDITSISPTLQAQVSNVSPATDGARQIDLVDERDSTHEENH